MALMFSPEDLVSIDIDYSSKTKGMEKVRGFFSKRAVPDPKATIEAGYPIEKDEIMITEFIDAQTTSVRPIRTWRSTDPMNFHPANDKESKLSVHHVDVMHWDDRFIRPKEWEAFLAGDKEQILGYRLDAFWAHSPSKATSYKHFGIQTVEQLADASDELISRILGGLNDREQCRIYLANAKQEQPSREHYLKLEQMEQRLQEKDSEVSELKEMMKQFLANQGGTAITAKKAGKPKKIKAYSKEEHANQ